MTDDLSALREEVARALWARDQQETGSDLTWDQARAKRHYVYLDDAAIAVEELFSDPVRLVRVLTNQPCATCGGAETVSYPDVPFIMAGTCPACKANPGRLDLVGLLVENGTLEAVEQRPWGFDPTIHNPGAAAFRRSSKEGSA